MNSPAAVGMKLGVLGILVISALAAAVLSSSPAHADIIFLQATLDGAQAFSTCPGGSPATGSGTFTYDTATNVLTYSISFGGFGGGTTITKSHFHGPAAPGSDAGIQLGIPDLISPSTGMGTLTAMQETDLLSSLWYVNYHTNNCPGGEIRGQLILDTIGGIAGRPELGGAPLGAEDSSGDGNGLIMAIAAGVVVGLGLAGGATLAWRRRAG